VIVSAPAAQQQNLTERIFDLADLRIEVDPGFGTGR
jgi:hypothetical protein